jgi:hypothetical protein
LAKNEHEHLWLYATAKVHGDALWGNVFTCPWWLTIQWLLYYAMHSSGRNLSVRKTAGRRLSHSYPPNSNNTVLLLWFC